MNKVHALTCSRSGAVVIYVNHSLQQSTTNFLPSKIVLRLSKHRALERHSEFIVRCSGLLHLEEGFNQGLISRLQLMHSPGCRPPVFTLPAERCRKVSIAKQQNNHRLAGVVPSFDEWYHRKGCMIWLVDLQMGKLSASRDGWRTISP